MFKILILSVILAVATANSVPRHRYQLNQQNVDIKREGRIVGGSDTTIENHPYQIGLFFNRRHTCGGSVLNVNTILSAAHCTYGRNHENFQVLAGQTDIRSVDFLSTATRVTQHPEYDDWELWNDIVILRLENNLVFGSTIRPTVLPSPTHDISSGSTCVVTGWGDLAAGARDYPDILQSVPVPSMTNDECQAIYDQEVILPQHFCAGEPGRDACQGDSGGPVTHNGLQMGVVSWGYGCAGAYPTVYARVSEFLPFIIGEMTRA